MAPTEVKPFTTKNPKRKQNQSITPEKDLKKTKKLKGLDFDAYIAKKNLNPKQKHDPSLAPNKDLKKKKKTKKSKKPKDLTFDDEEEELDSEPVSEPVSASEQLSYFFNQLESAIGVAVSSLELEPIKDKCIVELSERLEQDVSNLGEHIKMSCGDSWRETLCEGEEGKVESGNPSVLVISSSALRSLELLRY